MEMINRKQRRYEKKIKKLKLEITLIAAIAIILTAAIIYILKVLYPGSLF